MRFALLGIGSAALLASAVGLSACSPLVTLNDWMVPQDGYVRHRGIAYGEGPRHELDIYVPDRAAAAGGNAPVVVFFYGGAWSGGKRDYYPFIGEALARQGYVVVVPDYRVYPEVRFPEFVEDGAAALRWVEDNIAGYGGQSDAIVLMGHSAGAHIAAMLIMDNRYLEGSGVDRRNIRGFVGLAGPYAFDPARFRTTRSIFADAGVPTMPIGLVNGDEPPMLLLHGGQDGTVYPENSQALAGRVWATGGQAKLVEYPEKGHIDIVLAMASPFRDDGGPYAEIGRFLAAATGTDQPPADR